MQEAFRFPVETILSGLQMLASWPALSFLLTALILVGLFLAWIWLRLQPQPYFLHLVVFDILLLLYSTLFLLPTKLLLTYLAYLRFARYTQITFHFIMISWLATAPLGPIRSKAETTVKQVLFERWLFGLASLFLLGAALFLDARGLWLPIAKHDLYLWLLPVLFAIIFSLVVSTKRFIQSVAEYVTFLTAFAAFVLASYVHIFVNQQLSILPALLGSSSLIILILLHHRRFVSLEAQLRQGLYDENLQLRELNEIQEQILANTREAIIRLDRDEQIRYVNPAFLYQIDKKLAEVLGKKFREFVPAQVYEALTPALKEARLGRENSLEFEWPEKSQEKVCLLARVMPLMDERHKLTGFHVGWLEMTEFFQLRNVLQAKLERQGSELALYRSALENANNGLMITDPAGNILFANLSFCRMHGYRSSDLIGRNSDIIHIDTSKEKLALQQLQQGRLWRGRWRNRRKDGSQFLADIVASPILEAAQKVASILWVEEDAESTILLEQKLANAWQQIEKREKEIEMLEQYHHGLISALDTGLILVRADGACRYLNQLPVSLLGYQADEISLHLLPPFVKDLLKMAASYGGKIRAEATEFIDQFTRPDGSNIHLRWRAVPVAEEDGQTFAVLLQIFDVSEMQSVKARVQQLQQNLDRLAHEQANNLQDKFDQFKAILSLAEAIQLRPDFAPLLQQVIQTARKLGWPRVLIFQKDEDLKSYNLLGANGFTTSITKKLKYIPIEQIDKYFQTRFAVGDGFLLSSGEKTGPTKWDFIPEKMNWPGIGDWQDTVLLIPLSVSGRQVGLMMFGAPQNGKLPDQESLQSLQRLSLQIAFALDKEEQRIHRMQKTEQDQLLIDISQTAHLEMTPEQQLQKIARQLPAILESDICILVLDQTVMGICVPRKGRSKPAMFLRAKVAEDLFHALKLDLPLSGAMTISFHKYANRFNQIFGWKDNQKDRFLLLAPLAKRRKIRGILCCLRQGGDFKKAEVGFAGQLAERITLVIENALLFAEVERKAQELERANALISEFLSNVSHELRTPLHAILSYVELLRQKSKISKEERDRHLQTIQNSGQKLLRLINDLLDLSKIEAGKIVPQEQVFDPRELGQEIEQELSPFFDDKSVNFCLQLDEKLPQAIKTDRGMLYRAILNLARNAQKFTKEGNIQLSVQWQKPDKLCLRVEDTGIGIPENRLKDIFKPFYQLDQKATRRYEGTGLGLAITQKIVNLLHGEVSVQSRPGQGSTFTLEIPVQISRQKPHKPRELAPKKPKLRQKRVFKQSRQILLVDDDESTREAMKFLLENAGYQVEFANDGPAAISAAQHLQPDIILLDIMMPGMDGYQVARTLKSQKHLRQIPVIALTARAMSEDQQKAKEAGCDDFLTKPFSMDEFFNILERYTENGGR